MDPNWQGQHAVTRNLLEVQDGAQAVTRMQQIKGLVDLVKWHVMGDIIVQSEASSHVIVHQIRDLGGEADTC